MSVRCDSLGAFLETGKRSRIERAVILNRVPALFDAAHVGLSFTHVIGSGHRGAQTCIAFAFRWKASVREWSMLSWPLLAPARERNSSWSVMCRPTAPGLPM